MIPAWEPGPTSPPAICGSPAERGFDEPRNPVEQNLGSDCARVDHDRSRRGSVQKLEVVAPAAPDTSAGKLRPLSTCASLSIRGKADQEPGARQSARANVPAGYHCLAPAKKVVGEAMDPGNARVVRGRGGKASCEMSAEGTLAKRDVAEKNVGSCEAGRKATPQLDRCITVEARERRNSVWEGDHVTIGPPGERTQKHSGLYDGASEALAEPGHERCLAGATGALDDHDR